MATFVLQTMATGSGVSNGASADMTGGTTACLAHHTGVFTFTGWTTNTGLNYTPGVGIQLQASLDGVVWNVIAQNTAYANGSVTLEGVMAARYLRGVIDEVDPNVTAFSCSAYVGGAA